MGLQYKDSELIQVFYSCLDYPLSSDEMTELKTIVNSESSVKMADRPDSPASMGLMPEPSAFTDTTSVFPVVVNGATEVSKATPRYSRLSSKLAETPLDSSSALGSVSVYKSVSVQEFMSELTTANKFALESVPEPTPVNESASESASAQNSTLEPTPIISEFDLAQRYTPEPGPVQERSEST